MKLALIAKHVVGHCYNLVPCGREYSQISLGLMNIGLCMATSMSGTSSLFWCMWSNIDLMRGKVDHWGWELDDSDERCLGCCPLDEVVADYGECWGRRARSQSEQLHYSWSTLGGSTSQVSFHQWACREDLCHPIGPPTLAEMLSTTEGMGQWRSLASSTSWRLWGRGWEHICLGIVLEV